MSNGGNAQTDAPEQALRGKAHIGVIVAAAMAALLAVNDSILDIKVTVKTDNFEWFAVLYVVAQAIERFLEPFAARDSCRVRRPRASWGRGPDLIAQSARCRTGQRA